MNQFEFLRSVPIGQYLPVDSVLHRLDARARLLAYFALVLALTFSRHLAGGLLGLAAALIFLAVGRIPLRYALRGLATPLPFLILLAALQVLFNAGTPTPESVLFSIGSLEITPSDFWAGGMLLLRFAGLILTIGLATYTLSTTEMIQGLNHLLRPLAALGLPAQDLVMTVQVTLRFLPLLAQTAERIAKAQASRGADWDARGGNLLARARRIVPLIVPLFLASLRRAETMALAMDARAYGSAPARTSLVAMHFGVRDGLFVLLALLVAAAVVLL